MKNTKGDFLNELIRDAPQGVIVIVWRWGSQEITKRVKMK